MPVAELAHREADGDMRFGGRPGATGVRQLLDAVWGRDIHVELRTVDVHIRKVREKIGEGFIKTVKGVGYKFDLGEG